MRKRYCPDGPVQPGEGPQAAELISIPERHQSVRGSNSKIATCRVEFDADAGPGVGLDYVEQLQLRVAQDVDAALPVGQIKRIRVFVPGNFINFKVKLLFSSDFHTSGVNKSYQVLFITHGYSIAVGTP